MKPYFDDTDGRVTVYHGDCRDWDGSADVIVTDPPYGRKALPLWEELGRIGASSLPAGGWLLAYSGQACLPESMAALTAAGLTYCWTLCVSYPGREQLASIRDMAVLTGWKPIVAFRKPPFGSPRGDGGKFVAGGRFEFADLLRRGGYDKSAHEWAQPASEAAQLIERFAAPDARVLDPFMGSGSTLIATRLLGRTGIGIEIDEDHCGTAARRLGQGILDLGVAA